MGGWWKEVRKASGGGRLEKAMRKEEEEGGKGQGEGYCACCAESLVASIGKAREE